MLLLAATNEYIPIRIRPFLYAKCKTPHTTSTDLARGIHTVRVLERCCQNGGPDSYCFIALPLKLPRAWSTMRITNKTI
jgi:hypothetical protein